MNMLLLRTPFSVKQSNLLWWKMMTFILITLLLYRRSGKEHKNVQYLQIELKPTYV